MAFEFDSLYYLRFLSDFWVRFYKNEALVIEGALQATAQILKGLYFAFLQRQLPTEIKDFPIFQEQYWNIIELTAEEAVALDINLKPFTVTSPARFSVYDLDEPYIRIPFIYNLVFDPTVILKEGTFDELTARFAAGTPNVLTIGDDYLNMYNGIIINGTEKVAAGKVFYAAADSFTLEDTGSAGYVIKNRDYMVKGVVTEPAGDGLNGVISQIYFRLEADPFLNNAIAHRRLPNANLTGMALYAPKVFLDYLELHRYYGAVIGVFSKSSAEYRDFVSGILGLYVGGPTVSAINVALNVANGYPVARQDENITTVEILEEFFVLRSDMGNEYRIRRKVVEEVTVDPVTSQLVRRSLALPRLIISNRNFYNRLQPLNPITHTAVPFQDFTDIDAFNVGSTYNIFWPVTNLGTFIDQLKVVDYKTQPKWWLEKITGRMVARLANMPQNLREDKATIDRLFEAVLKINTFGVFVDARVIANFEGITDFVRILSNVKPTYKTFLVSEVNLVLFDELEAPEDSASLSMYLRLRDTHDWAPEIGMEMMGAYPGGPLELNTARIGFAFEEIGSAYEIPTIKYNMTAVLDDNGMPLPGSIYSIYNTDPGETLVIASGGPVPFIGLGPGHGLVDFASLKVGLLIEDEMDESEDEVTLDVYEVSVEISAVTDITEDSLTLNWLSFPGATTYYIDGSIGPVMGALFIDNLDVGNVLTYVVTGLSPNTVYSFVIRAEVP